MTNRRIRNTSCRRDDGAKNLSCLAKAANGAICLVLASGVTTGCGSLRHHDPVPAHLTKVAKVPGITNARVFVDLVAVDHLTVMASLEGPIHRAQSRKGPATLLAISGGGADGAFAVGLLNGWTERGDRPEFDIVTGISTGGLIGPLAFLGPQYDAELKEAYTTLRDRQVFKKRSLLGLARHRDALADSSPLAALIRRHFTKERMAEVAAEHRKGRRLYIGTTDLDAGLLVVWDVGAIASSGSTNAYELCCDVLLASASIPVAFPPVYFTVEADGQTYEEMHVDGGASSQVFGAYALVEVAKQSGNPEAIMYFIRNERLGPTWQTVKPKLTSIAMRSVSVTIKTQGVGDLYRAYALAQSAAVDFRLAAIPDSFEVENLEESAFDPHYMTALFEAAQAMAARPRMWLHQPPGLRTEE